MRNPTRVEQVQAQLAAARAMRDQLKSGITFWCVGGVWARARFGPSVPLFLEAADDLAHYLGKENPYLDQHTRALAYARAIMSANDGGRPARAWMLLEEALMQGWYPESAA